MRTFLLLATPVFLALPLHPVSATDNPVQTRTGFIQEKDYTVFVPASYKGANEKKHFPLILFLHGHGQAKTPPEKVPGLGPHIDSNKDKFPFFVIFPQGKHDGFWYDWSHDSKALDIKPALAMLDDVQKRYRIDPKRLYLTGVSMGGLGVWCQAEENPGRWAAIVPVSAGFGKPKSGDEALLKKVASVNEEPRQHAAAIKNLPCWCFHGLKDNLVDPNYTKDMVKALQHAGGHPKFTYPPQADHGGCWPIAYNTPDLYEWLAKQHQK